MIKGSVQAIVTLIFIPTMRPKLTAAKKAKVTKPTPRLVIKMRDSTTSQLNKKNTEKAAIMKIETITSTLLLRVISFAIVKKAIDQEAVSTVTLDETNGGGGGGGGGSL